MRNAEVHRLEEHIHILELKLVDMAALREQVDIMSEELRMSNMERELLVQELDRAEAELQSSSLSIEKLEESISSIALESQCEIESMKLDLMALEQKYFEAEKVQEETLQENARLNNLRDELEVRNEDAQGVINQLEKENKDSRERMVFSESNARVFCQKIEECIEEMQNNGRKLEFSHQLLLTKAGLSKEMGYVADLNSFH